LNCKKYYLAYLVFVSFSLCQNLFADYSNWYPVVGGNVGFSLIPQAGESKIFPVVDSNADQYYIYSVDDVTNIPALYGGFAGVAWKAESDWSFQLHADFNQSSLFSVIGDLVQGVDEQTQDQYRYGYNMRARQLLGLGKVEYCGSEIVTPYFLAGLGASFNIAQDYATTVPTTLASTRLYEDNSSRSVSYSFGCGADFHCANWLLMGLGYRFAGLGKVGLGQAISGTISVDGTLSQSSLYAHQFVVQVSFIF